MPIAGKIMDDMSDFGDQHFDRFQWDNRRARAVSAETRIDWNDYKGMGTENGAVLRHPRWIPAFASDNEKLKRVILARDAIHALVVTEHFYAECSTHLKAVTRCGSYQAFLAGIAVRAWRLRQDCVAIAAAMEITPTVVRRHLSLMVNAARKLGFETFAPHPTCGAKLGPRPRPKRKVRPEMRGRTLICVDCEKRPTAPELRRLCRECREIRLAAPRYNRPAA